MVVEFGIEPLTQILSYSFMQRALISGTFVAIACSILGVFLLLRRLSLFGDGLAHISFGGVAVAILSGVSPIVGAMTFAILGSLAILTLKQQTKQPDSAIGIVSHSCLGIGIFIVSISQGFSVDIMSYLFGSILAISQIEVWLTIALALIVIIVISVLYKSLVHVAFNEDSAQVSGIQVSYMNILLVVLTALTVVSAMNVVGLMLASALIILPASTAIACKKTFKTTLWISAIVGVISTVVGLYISFIGDFAPSGTIILVNVLILLSVLAHKKLTK
jgi:zinc transport system permease protein